MGTVIELGERPGTWFDLEGGGRVQLRTIAADALRKIKKQVTKRRAEIKRIDGAIGRVEWEEVDEDLQNELFWDAAILDWENLIDGKGNPIPCTPENKALLMLKSLKFARFVADGLKALSDAEIEEAEAAEKN